MDSQKNKDFPTLRYFQDSTIKFKINSQWALKLVWKKQKKTSLSNGAALWNQCVISHDNSYDKTDVNSLLAKYFKEIVIVENAYAILNY